MRNWLSAKGSVKVAGVKQGNSSVYKWEANKTRLQTLAAFLKKMAYQSFEVENDTPCTFSIPRTKQAHIKCKTGPSTHVIEC